MQTLAFMRNGAGLQFTALDGKAQRKTFDTRGLDMRISYKCPDEGVPGAANAPDYSIETAAFAGDWWVAAKRYRAWATRQVWASKGPALPGIPLALHWANWFHSPFDIGYPEMFPARDGVKESAEWMKGQGIFYMPYINGSIWDTNITSFAEAIPSTAKDTDGSYYTYKCSDGNVLARMCPTTALWRRRVAENARRLIGELDADGIYIDQISCSLPQPCHDASHGHRLGGGDFWTQGYRELMKPIREDAARRGVALTSESAAEPYLDSFDAFLTWTGHNPKDVPLLPAVYSGYALYFGSCQFGSDSLESYCALQARAFLWGCQLGWNQTRLAGPGMEKHAEFTRKLCLARLDNLDFFLYGELLGEVRPVGEVPMVDVKWDRDKVGEFKVPAVFGTVWQSDGGERRAFIVNITGEELRFAARLGEGETQIDVTIPPRSVMVCM